MGFVLKELNLPSGKRTWTWKISMFIGKSTTNGPCSIAMSGYQIVSWNSTGCLDGSHVTRGYLPHLAIIFWEEYHARQRTIHLTIAMIGVISPTNRL